MIRELHVYGSLSRHGEQGDHIQHRGLGKKLLHKAEEITRSHLIRKICIISGVGVREYYRKNGYTFDIETQMMIKELSLYSFSPYETLLIIILFITLFSISQDIEKYKFDTLINQSL